jgi:hypothetical protein
MTARIVARVCLQEQQPVLLHNVPALFVKMALPPQPPDLEHVQLIVEYQVGFVNNNPMRKFYTLAFSMTLIINASAQVSDMDIIKCTLGKNYSKMHKSLDSLGVWYAMHQDNDQQKTSGKIPDTKKIYSISDSKGSTKVWAVVLSKTGLIEELVLNFRHDSRQQVEDSRRLKDFTDFHVGLYSTDFVFKKKK